MAERAKLRLRIVASDKKFVLLSYRNSTVDQLIKKISSLYKQLYDTELRGRSYLTIDGFRLPSHYVLSDLLEDHATLHIHTETSSAPPEVHKPSKQPEQPKHTKPLQPSCSPVRDEPPKPPAANNKKRQRPEPKLDRPEKPPQKKKKPDDEEHLESRPQPTSKLLSLFNAPIKKEPSLQDNEDASSDESVFITHEEPTLPKGKPNLFRS